MTDSELKEIHSEALQEFDSIQSSVKDERDQCLEDRRFCSIPGAQWEGKLGQQFENKPKLEVNKIQLSVIRIFNEYRANRVTVDFVSKDGSQNSKLATVCDGLYRADEQDSGAQEAYDNAFDEATTGGMGAWRYRAEYEDDEDEEKEEQCIKIEPIYDADSTVFFDLNAKRQDKSDAKHGFILTGMTHAAYKDEYDDDVSTWDSNISDSEYDWNTPDIVYVAEYYRKEEDSVTIITYEHINGEEEKFKEESLTEEVLEVLNATGSKEVRRRKVKTRRVHKYIMSGSKVLEDCGFIAGSNIPIVPIYGKRWYIDNIERFMGHVRLAKDAQRLKNMQLSKLAELSALSAREKPIFAPAQVANHKQMWTDDNIKEFPFLLLDPLENADGTVASIGPQAYTKPPVIAPALAALLQLTEVDMKEILGGQGGEEIVSNISGKAVEMIQTRLDMQSYIYMDNFAKGMKRGGEIWLSMKRDITVEDGRKLKTINKQGEAGNVETRKPVLNSETGEIEYENDLGKAKFNVAVDVGPSSSSKKAATVRNIMGMMQTTADPETVQVLGAMAMMNMEGEGIEEVNGFFRNKLLKMGAIEPTEEEAKVLEELRQNAKPTAEEEYLIKEGNKAEAQGKESNAKTLLTLEKAEETAAKTVKTKAETMETLEGIQRDNTEQLLNTVDKLGEAVETKREGYHEQEEYMEERE